MAERTREEGVAAERGVRDRNGLRDDRDRRTREPAPGPATVRERQRDEYGGFNLGAAFFGWLVAVGLAVLLTALLSAAGAAIGLTEISEGEAESSAETISIVGGILLILVLALSYYAGGYVAGRMSRFDGGRQGLGVWLMGLLVTVTLAILGAIAGSEYNLFSQLNLPRIPIDEGSLAAGGAIALIAVLVATLVAAMAGGKVGERYHRKVDRAGYEPRRTPAA
jgi:MFS family permease